MKNFLLKIWLRGEKSNYNNVLLMLEHNRKATVLDCGCNSGVFTRRVASKIGTKKIFGIEIDQKLSSMARARGIEVKKADLNKKLPFNDASFDVVIASMVIEHLFDTDSFLDEIYRILKKGGYAVISTENLASWHNIFSLLFGWQPFAMTNVSKDRLGIGNPLSYHRQEKLVFTSMQHIRVFAYQGLKEILEIKGFRVDKTLGAGYFPLPNFLSRLNPRHSAFLTIKAKKT